VLTEKESVINVQQKLIWVSVALAFFMFFALFMIYRAYKTKKQMNIRLDKLVDIRTNELQLSREHFKNLFESSPVSIGEMDLSNFYKFISTLGKTPTNIIESIETNAGLVAQSIGQIKINDVNSATLELFGFKSKKEFIDNYIKTFNDQALADFQQTIKNFVLKQSNYTYETVRLTSNGEIKYIQVSWIVLPGFAENYGRVIVTMTDITEIKKHRDHLEELVNERSAKIIQLNRELTDTVEELENTVQKLQETQNHLIRAEKMASLGMLTAGIAHEINNPINYISASSQALIPLLNQIWSILGEQREKGKTSNVAEPLNSINVEELSSSVKFLVDNIEIGIKKPPKLSAV